MIVYFTIITSKFTAIIIIQAVSYIYTLETFVSTDCNKCRALLFGWKFTLRTCRPLCHPQFAFVRQEYKSLYATQLEGIIKTKNLFSVGRNVWESRPSKLFRILGLGLSVLIELFKSRREIQL